MAPDISHHEPLKALGPVEWDAIDHNNLDAFLRDTFSSAQVLVDSIPAPPPPPSSSHHRTSSTGRARSHTDSAVLPPPGALDAATAAADTRKTKTDEEGRERARKLQREWKEVKVAAAGSKDNPLGIAVHRLAAKDGRGSWFARRSVHAHHGTKGGSGTLPEAPTYEKFQLGLEREFAEVLKAREREERAYREREREKKEGGGEDRKGEQQQSPPQPGTGKVRGIGAERRVEHAVAEGVGKLEVYQLSAQFGGPTTPRDFVALILSTAGDEDSSSSADGKRRRQPRQFMVVSKPCAHPACPPRAGFIRGQYESVEVIREVPVERPQPLRRARSSIDLGSEEAVLRAKNGDDVSREAILRSAEKVIAAREAEGAKRGRGKPTTAVSFDGRSSSRAGGRAGEDDNEEEEDVEMAIEWLMVTRSDPGGSVPRFMVEKGTPGGIISDAGRLLDWISSKDPRDFEESEDNDLKEEAVEAEAQAEAAAAEEEEEAGDAATIRHASPPSRRSGAYGEAKTPEPAPSGFYGMIASALEAAGSVVVSRMPSAFSGSAGFTDSDPDLDSSRMGSDEEDEASSDHSFTSALESAPSKEEAGDKAAATGSASPEVASVLSSMSDASRALSATTTTASTANTATPTGKSGKAASTSSSQHEKELRKLEERRRKVQEKVDKAAERALAKQRQKDDGAAGEAERKKLREKHERELARQEEKYQRELRKLEQKRAAGEKKAEERRRKQAEREARADAALELERARAERDVALKRAEMLSARLGELQAQNTMLVARLGRNGLLDEEDLRRLAEEADGKGASLSSVQ